MQYRAFEPGIQVNGQTVWAVVDAFDHFKQIPSRILLAEGIGIPGRGGVVRIDPASWFPQEAWLRALERVAAQVGESKLYAIGVRIPRNAKVPSGIDTVFDGIASIDVGYHMNHRKNGHVMFDGSTGHMLEGIGHYGVEKVGPREIVSVCDTPYPCAFDRGVLTCVARRFERSATVEHVDSAPCRRRGDDACTYRVCF